MKARIVELEAERDKLKKRNSELFVANELCRQTIKELREQVADAEYWARSRGETIDWEHYHKLRLSNDEEVAREPTP